MIYKKHTSLLSAKIGADSSNYVNHHSSWSSPFICDNNENGNQPVFSPFLQNKAKVHRALDYRYGIEQVYSLQKTHKDSVLIAKRKISYREIIVRLDSDAFRDQGPQGRRLCFHGSISTDGVGLSILKATKATKGGGAGSNQPDGVYIARPDVADELPSEICIMMDPNRRDLLYYMHERDSRANKLEERFTSNNLSLECHRWLKENSMIKKTWAIVWSFLSGLPVFKASLWRLLET